MPHVGCNALVTPVCNLFSEGTSFYWPLWFLPVGVLARYHHARFKVILPSKLAESQANFFAVLL
jgi:hypothetical protein